MSDRIVNAHYLKFLREGMIDTLEEEDILKACDNVTGNNKKQGRALIIALYFTGARPNEVLDIKSKDVKREGSYVHVFVKGSKNGLPRTIWLPYKSVLVKEFLSYANSLFPDMRLFWAYRSKYKREVVKPDGSVKEYHEVSAKLRHHFKRWFVDVLDDPIPPYYLRHNRMSKLSMAGVEMQDLRMIKGAKTFDSITPYLHLSAASAMKIAKKLK